MATVDEALQTQIRNIEAQYGRTMGEWTEVIRASGLSRHGQIVAMLKQDHGLSHGSANRVALIALDALRTGGSAVEARAGVGGLTPSRSLGAPAAAADLLYADRPSLRPIHERLMTEVSGIGPDIEVAPKRGYLSLRRRTQFGMVRPAARHVDVGLILPDAPHTERFEPAATWNAMFTHRVRIRSTGDVDAELVNWIRRAYEKAI